MTIFHWLLLGFLLVPLAEIYVLLKVGSIVGPFPTILLVVFTAVLGAVLVRAQGFSTIARVRTSMDRGEVPAVPIMEGAFLLLAGALLLTPGFITDAIGFACLTPPLRQALITRFIEARVVPPPGQGQGGGPQGAPGARPGQDTRGVTLEGEYRKEE